MERTIVKPHDIKIPEGMQEAIRAVDTSNMDAGCAKGYVVSVALAWLANNPTVPTNRQITDMLKDAHMIMDTGESAVDSSCYGSHIAQVWVRRMFQ